MATPLLISDFLDRFGKHAATSEAMAGKSNLPVIPQYGFQTGYDFQENFPGLNPKISSGLAKGYQTLQEGARALLDGPGGVTLQDALETAKNQAAQNIEGILASASGNITAEQLANRNAYLANQGFQTETPRQSSSFRSMNNPNVYGTNRTEDQLAMDREIATKGIMNNPELLDKFDRSPASSEVRQTIGSRIKEGIGSAFDKIRSVSPTGIISNLLSNLNRFDTLSAADQDFITSQGLGQDKYGYNKRSMFGNYANLVKERAKIAADRRLKGLGQRAIDEYYEKLEKERQRQYEAQIQNAINEGRQMQQSYESHFSNMGYSSPAERAADTPTGTLGRI